MEKIEIKQIPFDLPFEGYYWYSDKSAPQALDNETISESIFNLNELPFIVEGNLYNDKEKISINIKNIDGEYLITRANLKGLTYKSEEYLAHRLVLNDGTKISKIKLAHYWQESETDDLLAGMTTLMPVWMAFTGFVKQ
jgi:CRISPR type III-associated protein (TIGR04423 family)